MKRLHLAAAVAVLGACIIGSSSLVAGAAGKGSPATVKLKAVVDSFHQVDNAPEGDTQGDVLVFTQKLTDASGKQIGTADAYCVRTAPGRVRECQGTFFLPKGQVFVSGPDPDNVKRHALAITGGTKAYTDARGHVTLDHKSAVEDGDTFTFTR
jgi:hypothetical protein